MDEQARRWRRRAIASWIIGAGLLLTAFAAIFVLAATDPGDNIALGGNRIVRTADGGRAWHGVFWNHSDSVYTDLDAIVLFLDRDGRPVGQARGGARRLDPGQVFSVYARLPRGTARLQLYRMRWTTGGGSADLGPFRPWPFGYVTDAGCDATRLWLGSCTPMRK